MTPLQLLMRSDAAVALAGGACLVGWLAGCAFMVALFWRRLTHPIDGSVVQLKREADDAHLRAVELRKLADELACTCSEKQRVIDDQTAQIGQLYHDVNKMARLAIDEAAKAHARGAA